MSLCRQSDASNTFNICRLKWKRSCPRPCLTTGTHTSWTWCCCRVRARVTCTLLNQQRDVSVADGGWSSAVYPDHKSAPKLTCTHHCILLWKILTAEIMTRWWWQQDTISFSSWDVSAFSMELTRFSEWCKTRCSHARARHRCCSRAQEAGVW